MPRPHNTTLARLGEAFDELVKDVIAILVPQPEPRPVPVRVREQR